MNRRKIPIFKSLNDRNLILGCERELILSVALFSVALVLVGQSLATFIIGPVIWTISLFFLRKMAVSDPDLSKIFVRHVRQQVFYSAKSKPWRKD
jgi:type IV secretory pathway TrbD component